MNGKQTETEIYSLNWLYTLDWALDMVLYSK